jgi:hypothetical protein
MLHRGERIVSELRGVLSPNLSLNPDASQAHLGCAFWQRGPGSDDK